MYLGPYKRLEESSYMNYFIFKSWLNLGFSQGHAKHEFFVDMTCEGCSNAVTRVLHRLGGVQFDIDLPNKKVFIDSEHNVDTLLETLKKTGKNASYLGEKPAQ
ncbi:Copper transport protein ATOX1 [Pitangus sulphuratus]|nr:Copper transport protein ATOX1 [Pitangus sulphuratus]